MDYVISEEIARQLKQRFIRKVEGKVNDVLTFKIDFDNVEIVMHPFRYKDESQIPFEGRELIELPSLAYKPFKTVIMSLAKVIGTNGIARVATFPKGIHYYKGHDWDFGEPVTGTLEESVDKYKFGCFEYHIQENGTNLTFSSDREPNQSHGTLDISVPIKHFPVAYVMRIEEVLDNLN